MPRAESSAPSLVGKWRVRATVPGGGAYTGTIRVSPIGETLELVWDTTAGRYSGLGLEEGGAWYVACGEDARGLGLALVGPGGQVRWSPAPTPGTVGREVLAPGFTKVGGPAWVAAGPAREPAGLPFQSVTLHGGGELREAALVGGPVQRGLALSTAVGWAIAWYPRFDQTVILRYLPGRRNTWRAVWALGGRSDVAVERLRPAR